MTHRRSDARSDGVELELAALRGRVAMVEPNWWRHGQRATSSPLSSSGSGWTTSGCGPASMSWPPRSSSCDGRPSGRLPVLQGHHGGPPPTAGPQGGHGLRPPRTPPGPRPRPGQPGHRRWAARGLSGALSVEWVACQYQEDLPPLPATEICRYDIQIGRCQRCRRRVSPATPGRPRKRWCGRRPGRPACGRAGGVGVQGAPACRLARSPGCSASSASKSPQVG
jgi:hypothetical protein